MPARLTIEPGDRYGRLVIVREAPMTGPGKRWFVCRCDCGTTKTIRMTRLTTACGPTRSCGCLQRERARDANRTHGHSGGWHGPVPRLYSIWAGMKSRCQNPNEMGYHNYGGRGISVCDEWQAYAAFEAWALQHGYGPRLTIERMDVDGDYAPSNCTWIPRSRQIFNTRRSRRLEYKGRAQTLTEWARELGIHEETLRSRIERGWGTKRALSTPVGGPS